MVQVYTKRVNKEKKGGKNKTKRKEWRFRPREENAGPSGLGERERENLGFVELQLAAGGSAWWTVSVVTHGERINERYGGAAPPSLSPHPSGIRSCLKKPFCSSGFFFPPTSDFGPSKWQLFLPPLWAPSNSRGHFIRHPNSKEYNTYEEYLTPPPSGTARGSHTYRKLVPGPPPLRREPSRWGFPVHTPDPQTYSSSQQRKHQGYSAILKPCSQENHHSTKVQFIKQS